MNCVSAAMFKTDFFVCGIAPMGENLVILSYDLDGMQQEVCIKVGATDNAAMVVQLQCIADSLFSSALEHVSALKGQSVGLDEGCGLQNVLHVAPQLFLQRCSVRPLLASLRRGQNCRTCSGDCDPVWLGQSSACASTTQQHVLE